MFIFRHFWIALIVATSYNALVIRKRGLAHVASATHLLGGYEVAFRVYLILGNLPWVIMGMGCLFGSLLPHDFLEPNIRDPYMVLFHATIVLNFILTAWWLFFQRGVDFLERHSALVSRLDNQGNPYPVTSGRIKLIAVILLLIGSAAMISMWTSDPS